MEYIRGFLAGWKSTAGAIAWVRGNTKAKAKREGPQRKGPLGFIKKWLKDKLAQEEDVWQADFRQMPKWIRIGGEPQRPWTILVASLSNDLILVSHVPETEPAAAELWDALVRAMQHPAAGEPHRPTEIQVRPGERWASLRAHLEEIGVGLVESQPLDYLDAAFQNMHEHVCGRPEPGLLDMPGITPEQVGGFYEAAAAFYRQAPWKKVGYESAIQVVCDQIHSGPWYAVLMGQSGLSLGLAVYESLEALRRLWATDGGEEAARQMVGTSVSFEEEWDIPLADLVAAQRYGWPVARPDAYPEVFHKDRGLSRRPPLAWELELVEACLRTIPEFVNRRKQDDPTQEEFTVPVAAKPFKVALSWVVEENG